MKTVNCPTQRYTADDPDDTSGTPTTIRWSTSGWDGGDFLIDENGVLTSRNPPDHERPADSNRDNEYEVTVRAYDGRAYGTFDVKVIVREVNESPVITGRDTFTYREKGTGALYTYRATDPERDEFTGSLGGSDAGDFAISELGGVLIFATPPDFESPAGSGTDGNEYLVTVQARDVQFNTGEFEITVTVTDQNEGPMVSGRGEISVQENSDPAQALASYSAMDPEGLPITRWSLSGSDGGDFVISETGTLTFRNTPDYDRPADSNRDNIYLVTVRAYDGRVYGGLDVTVTVLSENETAPAVTGRDTLTVRENTTSTLYTYRATDSDRNTVFSWSVACADGGDFEISDQGALTFANPPNYERPADSGGDNVHDIVVRASDGRNAGELAVTVTVTPVNEGPEITGQTARTVSENYDAVLATYSATDPEDTNADITRWSISGRDGGDFRINEDGELTFPYPPNYERPADSNRDNEYLVAVRASDGRYHGTFEVIVTLTETDEPPEFRSGSRTEFTYRENGTSSLYTYSATDPEGTGVTWSVSGDDGNKFETSDRGVLTFAEPPDFDVAGDSDGDNEYEITVLATDEHGLPRMLAVTVAVTDVNEGLEIIGCTGITDCDAITVFENYDLPLATHSAQDPEEPTADITRWSATGTDGGDFVINEDGELPFRNDPDYEGPADSNRNNEYLVTVRASDGHYYGSFKVTITVDPVNESPEIAGTETFSYRENDTRDLATYRATDPRAPALHGRCPASTRMTWKSGTGAC